MNNILFIKILFAVVSLIIIFSYYVLFFLKPKKKRREKYFDSITIIIPVHNEEDYIEECLRSVINAKFNGKKEIIVVNDGSRDNSKNIIKGFKDIKLINTNHIGKSACINLALKRARGDLVAIVDGDSVISEDSLERIKEKISQEKVGAVTCPVGVRNRNRFFCMWLHISEIYYSLIKELLSKIGANITTPGPLSVFRKDALLSIGGFSTNGLSEDVDVGIRLIRKGYFVEYENSIYTKTNMPHKIKWIFLQRIRFAKGFVNIVRKHLKVNKTIIDIYTLPLMLFNYFQSIIMGPLMIYQIIDGYLKYFVSYGIYFSFDVIRFLFEWMSLIGFFKWIYFILVGQAPFSLLSILSVLSMLLTYPLYIISFLKYDKKIDIYHIIPIIFLTPYWIFIMITQIIAIPEYFNKNQYNIWKKNE